MIVRYNTIDAKRNARLSFMKQAVFMIAHKYIKPLCAELSIEELFATAENFIQYLIDNEIEDDDLIKYEVEDLKAEWDNEQDCFLLIFVSMLKCIAISQSNPKALATSTALMGCCSEHEGFYKLLANCNISEHELLKKGWRAELLENELKAITNSKSDIKEAHEVINRIIDNALHLSKEEIKSLIPHLSLYNHQENNVFANELNRLYHAVGLSPVEISRKTDNKDIEETIMLLPKEKQIIIHHIIKIVSKCDGVWKKPASTEIICDFFYKVLGIIKTEFTEDDQSLSDSFWDMFKSGDENSMRVTMQNMLGFFMSYNLLTKKSPELNKIVFNTPYNYSNINKGKLTNPDKSKRYEKVIPLLNKYIMQLSLNNLNVS